MLRPKKSRRPARFGHNALNLVCFAAAVGLLVGGLPNNAARGALSATATITTADTSAPYSYDITLHNTGTVPIDTFWFAWLDSPDTNFMPLEPTDIDAPYINGSAYWYAYETANAGGDGFGIDFSAYHTQLAAGAALNGFVFTSDLSPADLLGSVNVPSVGTFPITHSFVYSGADSFQFTTQVVPEPASMLLAALGGAGAIVLIARERRRKAARRDS